MNIIVCLSSPLLSIAIRDLIDHGAPEHQAMLMSNGIADRGPQADAVLVDCVTLLSESRRFPRRAKLILLDIGLRREQVVTLMRTHRLAGVISPRVDFALFRKALKVIRDGQVWMENDLIRDLLGPEDPREAEGGARLTSREQQVVAHLCRGMSNRRIAEELCVSEQTVKGHLNRIFKRYGVSSRAQLISVTLGPRI
jgi:DNA-binding NarL/FixJ family response regulator